MNNLPYFAAVITAAGSSERFNRNRDLKVKKEYLQIDGHTVLYRAAEPFFEIPGLAAICVTCPEGSEDETLIALEDLINVNSIPFLIIPGGKTRKESVTKALEKIAEVAPEVEYVAIHDGARPFVTPDLIISTLATATIVGGAAPAIRITDSVKKLGPDGFIHESVDRSQLIRVQTPQIFRFKEILDAHRNTDNDAATDDIELYIAAGNRCTVVQGTEENRKITYFKDIPDAEAQAEEYVKALEEGRKSASANRRMRELMYGFDKKPSEKEEEN